jgi:cytochrome c-type biogenesis protein CcmH/NrfG
VARVDDAETFRGLQKKLAQRPDDARSLREACVVLGRMGRVNEAAKLCRHALSIDGSDLAARRALARVYASGGAYQWSVNEWRQVLAMKPRDPEAQRAIRSLSGKI